MLHGQLSEGLLDLVLRGRGRHFQRVVELCIYGSAHSCSLIGVKSAIGEDGTLESIGEDSGSLCGSETRNGSGKQG